MVLSITDDVITVYHTEIVQEHNGKGYAQLLLDELVLYTRKKKYKIIPLCPYVLANFKRHPEAYNDIWKKN